MIKAKRSSSQTKDAIKKEETERPELTTLLVFGEAPWLISWWTILSCPINAATWIGVRPDWTEKRRGEMNENNE